MGQGQKKAFLGSRRLGGALMIRWSTCIRSPTAFFLPKDMQEGVGLSRGSRSRYGMDFPRILLAHWKTCSPDCSVIHLGLRQGISLPRCSKQKAMTFGPTSTLAFFHAGWIVTQEFSLP